MSGKKFVDTNILLYSRDSSEPHKQSIAANLIRSLWIERTGRISVQVLNEYFVNVTQKLKPGLSKNDAWLDLQDLAVWNPVSIDMALLHKGKSFQDQYSLSWWDALILAAADQSGCNTVYSEDLSHGQPYFGIQVINPFV
jgi:predicted nucleic acid-binding protein